MVKIAVFANEKEEISSFTESKSILVFGKDLEWQLIEKISLVSDNAKGINELRSKYNKIAADLEDCKIIIVTKALGIPYSVFYGDDFSVWELEGSPLDYLDQILEKEEEHEAQLKRLDEEENVEKISEGHYLVDLSKLELTKPELSSKKIIIPFVEKTKFEILEVHCCHVPPWLIKQKEALDISMDIEQITRNKFKLYIKKGGK